MPTILAAVISLIEFAQNFFGYINFYGITFLWQDCICPTSIDS